MGSLVAGEGAAGAPGFDSRRAEYLSRFDKSSYMIVYASESCAARLEYEEGDDDDDDAGEDDGEETGGGGRGESGDGFLSEAVVSLRI